MSHQQCISSKLIALLAATLIATACGTSPNNDAALGADECIPPHEVDTHVDGTLTVSAATFPPIFELDAGEPGGIEGELIALIAEDYCLDLQLDVMSGEAVIPAVIADRADVAISGWYRTAERAEVVNLSDPIYVDHIGIISPRGARGLDDLEGVVATATGNAFNPEIEEVLVDRLRLYPGFTDVFADLETGRIEEAIVLYNSALVRLSENPLEGLELVIMDPDPRVSLSERPAQVGLPHTKDNESLELALNEAVARYRDEGVLEDILTRYGFPIDALDVGEPYLLGE